MGSCFGDSGKRICIVTAMLLCNLPHIGGASEHLLSFVIPCYNGARTIREAVRSIVAQRAGLKVPFEIVCCDDGSTDDSWKVLNSLRRRIPELRLLRHQKNRGGSAARNTAIAHAKGDLIFMLDADNALYDSVQTLIDAMDARGADVMAPGHVVFAERGVGVTGHWTYSDVPCLFRLADLLCWPDNPAADGNYLFSKRSWQVSGGYPEGKVLDTLIFGYRQAAHGFYLHVLSDFRIWHYVTPNSYYTRGAAAGLLDREWIEAVHVYLDRLTPRSQQLITNAVEHGFPSGFDYVAAISSGYAECSDPSESGEAAATL
ncbi:MAG: glycosyltransferase family 2 protein [Chlamydiia bacterium]